MLKLWIVSVTLLNCFSLASQTKKTFTVKPGEKVVDVIPLTEIFKYPEFKPAFVMLKSGVSVPTKVNYNSLFSEMLFIDQKGDTLALSDEKTIRLVAVEKDTFYFHEGWLELVINNTDIKLAGKRTIDISDKTKTGAMGLEGHGDIETSRTLTGYQQIRELIPKETLTFTENITYYFADRFNNFSRANKKSLLNICRKQQAKIEDYLQHNKTDFTSEEDLKRLFSYLNGL
jgi:hypothetical protein